MRVIALSLTLLAGCSGIVPGTALLLSNTDPLAADPGQISVALDLPEGIGVLPGSVKLSLEAEREGFGKVGDVWTLEQTQDASARQVFRVAEADHAELRSVQTQAREWNVEDPDGTRGSLSLSIGGCRTVPADELADARASVFIGLRNDAPMRPLFLKAPISEVLSEEQVSALPRCP